MSGFNNGNDFGVIAAAGMALNQNRYDGYVQAFLAQGMTLAQARAAANEALGIRPTPPRHYLGWAVPWGAAAAFMVVVALGVTSGPGAGGAVIMSVGIAVVCGLVSAYNLVRAFKAATPPRA